MSLFLKFGGMTPFLTLVLIISLACEKRGDDALIHSIPQTKQKSEE
jgi:hypothetical protein